MNAFIPGKDAAFQCRPYELQGEKIAACNREGKEEELMKKVIAVLLLYGTLFSAGNITAGDWTENIKVKGDLRYRHEMIDKQDSDSRHRHRLRVRVGIEGKVSSTAEVIVQLATGSDDPVSTNQTLDGAFSTKSIGLDLAYLQFSPEKLTGLTILGGK